MIRFKDSVTKHWNKIWCSCIVKDIISKPSSQNNHIANLKVKWDTVPTRGWISHTESVAFDTRLWNDGKAEGAWRLDISQSEEYVPSVSSPKNCDLRSILKEVMNDPMLDVPVGDLYTGSAITTGCNRHVGDKSTKPPKGVDRVRPLPLTLFGDGATLDPFGANSCVPVSLTLGIYTEEMRAKEVNNVVIGIVPNVSVRQGRRANEADLEMHALGRQKRTRGDKKRQIINKAK